MKRNIKIGYGAGTSNILLFLAIKKSQLFNTKVYPDLKLIWNPIERIEALLNGELDIICTTGLSSHLMIASDYFHKYLKYIRFHHFAYLDDQNQIDRIIVIGQSGIDSVKQLAGKKIGYIDSSTIKTNLELVLQKNGISTTSIGLVPVTIENQEEKLLNRSIDALFTYEPYTSAFIKLGAKPILTGGLLKVINPYPAGVCAVNLNFKDKNKDLFEDMMESFDNMIEFLSNNPEESYKILAEFVCKDLKQVKDSTFYRFIKSDEINDELIDNIRMYNEILYKYEKCDAIIRIDKLLI